MAGRFGAISNGLSIGAGQSVRRNAEDSAFEAYDPASAGVTVTTKGDVQTYSTTPARLPVGTDGQFLSALASETTGLKWASVPASNSVVLDETPTGSINSSNAEFTLANTPQANTLQVFLNGQRLTNTVDFTLSTATITMTTAPTTGDILRVSYQYAGASTGNADSVDNLHASDDSTSGNIIPFYDGWYKAGETWNYASADDPTFTFTISGDKTSKYSAGMRIKLTQTTVKYFIITKVEYSSPNTTITVYGGTDYDLANAAITSPYYSTQKAPQGFPLDPTKWTVEASDVGNRTQGSPTAGTWYNVSELNTSVPIGVWDVYVKATLIAANGSSGFSGAVALSSANNSASDEKMKATMYLGSTDTILETMSFRGILVLAAKATYYLNIMADTASTTSIGIRGDSSTTVVRFVCAYL